MDRGTKLPSHTTPPGPVTHQISEAGFGATDYFYSHAVKVVVDVPIAVAPGMAWDGFWRLIYDKTNEDFTAGGRTADAWIGHF